MVLGSYYLTIDRAGELGEGKAFRDFNEAMMAYENHELGLHAAIKCRVFKEKDGVMQSKVINTTLGRLIFNQPIPQDLGFVDRSDPEKFFDLEIDFVTTKKELGEIVDRCIKTHTAPVTAQVLDDIKDMGYKYSTKGSLSISYADITVPKEKKELVAAAEQKVDEINNMFQMGMLSEDERYRHVISIWNQTTADVTAALQNSMDRYLSLIHI